MNVGSGSAGSMPSRSRSTEDIYSRSEPEASAANKEDFFARKMAQNESRPEGIPPSQGVKCVGFGSSPAPSQRNNPQQNDYFSVVSQVMHCIMFVSGIRNNDHCNMFYVIFISVQGIGKLSLVAASAAQSAANVVQAGTKEITTKVFAPIQLSG